MARGGYDSSRVKFMCKEYDAVLALVRCSAWASTIKTAARSGRHL